MKRTKKCPKCKSSDIIEIPGGRKMYSFIPTGAFSAINVIKLVCGNCGHIEDWLEDVKDIQKIKDKFGDSF